MTSRIARVKLVHVVIFASIAVMATPVSAADNAGTKPGHRPASALGAGPATHNGYHKAHLGPAHALPRHPHVDAVTFFEAQRLSGN